MKATGIVRRIDDLDRVVIPKVVPSEWEDYLSMNKNVGGFGVYPVLCSGETFGYADADGMERGINSY